MDEDIRITISFTPSQHEWLVKQAEQDDRSIASLIRQLIEKQRVQSDKS